ncbi:MAG: hypothetical protein HP496_16940 [Nitrospira sp.]|nr:hypothetical protein [Nitrospira sp.]
MFARLMMIGLTLVPLWLTWSELATAGFFDEVLEEGKKKVQEEAGKLLKPVPAPRPSQSTSQPQQESSPSANPVKPVPRSAGDPAGQNSSAARSSRSEALSTVQGAVQFYGAGVHFDLVRKYVDQIALGLVPGYFEQRADCYARFHLPASESDKYIGEKGDWKGNNEFEKPRTRQAFIDAYRSQFQAQAVQLPVNLALVQQALVMQYNFNEQAIPLQFMLGGHGSFHPLGIAQDRYWFFSEPAPKHFVLINLGGYCSSIAFGVAAPAGQRGLINLKKTPEEAEILIKRIESPRSYIGIIFELAQPSASGPRTGILASGNLRASGPSEGEKLSLIQATAKSIGWYEDPDLERLITRLDGQAAGNSPLSKSDQKASIPPDAAQNLETASAGSSAGAAPRADAKIESFQGKKISNRAAFTLLGPSTPGLYSTYGHDFMTSMQHNMSYYMTMVALGLKPDSFEKVPYCYLNYTPSSVFDAYAKPIGGLGVSEWKGSNVFEADRSKRAFIRDYAAAFKEAVVKLPVEFVVIQPMELQKYDAAKKTFNTLPYSREITEAIRQGKGCSVVDFVINPFTASNWEISPGDAESLVNRLQKRVVYFGSVVRLTPEDFEERKLQVHGNVKSIGVYEDPDLERLIQTIEVKPTTNP